MAETWKQQTSYVNVDGRPSRASGNGSKNERNNLWNKRTQKDGDGSGRTLRSRGKQV